VTGSAGVLATTTDPAASPGARAAAPSARAASLHALQTGTRLHEFEITDPLGEGGFSIVYRAWDHSLERVVALKEYMPGSLASRDQDTRVHVRSAALQSTFDAGLRSFVNESKLLASFDHPSLVKVYRFWEANGTAYMVMPFYEGRTLRDTVQAMPGAPGEAWILELLAPLTEALGYIHARSCYHRDIAPDNILMLADSGRPLLLDFGAARRVITDMSQALTVIVKAGYAPIEQYAEVADMSQGAWTDVHALAAVIYWMVTGKKPPAAISRMLKDNHVPLAAQSLPGYSPEFLGAIDRGLALLPQDRTRSIEAFADEIGLRRPASQRAAVLGPHRTDPAARATGHATGATPTQLAPTQLAHTTTQPPPAEASVDIPLAPEEGDVDDDVTVVHPDGGSFMPTGWPPTTSTPSRLVPSFDDEAPAPTSSQWEETSQPQSAARSEHRSQQPPQPTVRSELRTSIPPQAPQESPSRLEPQSRSTLRQAPQQTHLEPQSRSTLQPQAEAPQHSRLEPQARSIVQPPPQQALSQADRTSRSTMQPQPQPRSPDDSQSPSRLRPQVAPSIDSDAVDDDLTRAGASLRTADAPASGTTRGDARPITSVRSARDAGIDDLPPTARAVSDERATASADARAAREAPRTDATTSARAPEPAPRGRVALMSAVAVLATTATALTAWWMLRAPAPQPEPTLKPVARPTATPVAPPAVVAAPSPSPEASAVSPAGSAPVAATPTTAAPPVEVAPAPAPAPANARTPEPAPTTAVEAPPSTRRPRATPSAKPPAVANPNAAECARILQRLSLGETSPDLLERAGSLHCK